MAQDDQSSSSLGLIQLRGLRGQEGRATGRAELFSSSEGLQLERNPGNEVENNTGCGFEMVWGM